MYSPMDVRNSFTGPIITEREAIEILEEKKMLRKPSIFAFDEFDEALMDSSFVESLRKGEICEHGERWGDCKDWCKGNPEAAKEMA